MERFRLRVRYEPKRGQIWELHLFPDIPGRPLREADGRALGTASNPEAIFWLRQIAASFLQRAEAPGPIAGDQMGPEAEPRWLRAEDGMRLALAFTAARWLASPRQRNLFRAGLEELPSEVVLYWFTLCFYGYRQAAGRAALRTLFTHEEPEPEDSVDKPLLVEKPKRKSAKSQRYDLLSLLENKGADMSAGDTPDTEGVADRK